MRNSRGKMPDLWVIESWPQNTREFTGIWKDSDTTKRKTKCNVGLEGYCSK